ncbi:MAG: HlyC/CorC family transporter [Deltaproteobacteria bacterium]|nr:HlyC/CorC family transporter [Deltaproteobacteria bacterium]
MDYLITLKLGLLVILVLCSAFFSGSEAAFFSLSTLHLHKMKEDKMPFVRSVAALLTSRRRLLITVLVGNESTNVCIAAVTTSLLIYFIGTEGKWVSIALTTVGLLIFGEAIPKTVAVIYPMAFSSAVSPPLTLFSRIAYPLVYLLVKISDFFFFLLERGTLKQDTSLMEDDFKALVKTGHQEGTIEETQKDLINSVFELADTTVSEIMTPRVDMFCLPITMDARKMESEILKARHARIPVYDSDKDDIIGILHAKDLLTETSKGKKKIDIRPLLKKPYYVPTERRAHSMLRDFQSRQIQMAVVVDEYGGIEGIATLTDILECLFGDIYAEYGSKGNDLKRIDANTALVAGMMEIEDFNAVFHLSVPTEDFDTIGGFVLHLFGALPLAGDSIEYENCNFSVEKITKARIITLKVTTKEVPDND